MDIKIAKPIGAIASSICFLAISGSGAANAASSEEARYTHPACADSSKAICGVIVMGAAGAYTLDWVSVTARDSQPDSQETHPSCSTAGKKLDRNVPAGNYDTFIMPASCAYTLKVGILAGNNKDQNLFLTPGCQIIARVDGTVVNNSWKSNKVSTLSEQVPTNSSGKPIDRGGHKCGKLKNAGF
ncbi:MAG: hypothetical protein ACX94B_14385 [Henriciella sp.]|nr:hypothetical protein [Hyphomonadaceae bacterium]